MEDRRRALRQAIRTEDEGMNGRREDRMVGLALRALELVLTPKSPVSIKKGQA